MKRIVKKLFFFLFCIFLPVDLLLSQISISMPDSTVCKDYEFSLPVQIESSVDDSIIAYQVHFVYDPAVIDIYKASSGGSITEDWGTPICNTLSGEFRAAGFSFEYQSISPETSLDTLFFINIRVLQDMVSKTNIYLQEVLLYNGAGKMNVEIPPGPLAVLNIIHNEFPQINGVPDVNFFEDSTFIFNIDSYINDNDCSNNDLKISILGNEHLSCYKKGHYLTIIPEQDWNGVETIALTVADNYNYTDSDTIQIIVWPLEDAPKPFQLISPLQDTLINKGVNEIKFYWQKSKNVDRDDSISYTVYFGTDSTFQSGIIKEYSSIKKETISLNVSVEEGEYYWGVLAIDSHGNSTWSHDKFRRLSVPTSVIPPNIKDWMEFKLNQNFPNPFNLQTNIEYQLSKPTNVKVTIYDIMGRYIKTLVDAYFEAGNHSLVWNGLDKENNPMSSGIYLIYFRAGNIIKVRRVDLIK